MPLKYLIDEHLRGKFTQALISEGIKQGLPLDVLETGGDEAPPLSTLDDGLLRWAEANDRVLVSLDKRTLPEALETHLATGASSPGILLIRRGFTWEDILYYLVLFAEVAVPDEYKNRCTYIPL